MIPSWIYVEQHCAFTAGVSLQLYLIPFNADIQQLQLIYSIACELPILIWWILCSYARVPVWYKLPSGLQQLSWKKIYATISYCDQKTSTWKQQIHETCNYFLHLYSDIWQHHPNDGKSSWVIGGGEKHGGLLGGYGAQTVACVRQTLDIKRWVSTVERWLIFIERNPSFKGFWSLVVCFVWINLKDHWDSKLCQESGGCILEASTFIVFFR